MKRVLGACLLVIACGKPDAPPPVSGATTTPAPAATTSTPGACPADGRWAQCSVIYRLERAGLAPKIDSTAKPGEAALSGTPLMLKIGASAQLELHIYTDSLARIADGAKLDRAAFVGATGPQTMKRERTLIESVNLIGLLTSINGKQRERISDALSAGPPQPEQPQVLQPVKSGGR